MNQIIYMISNAKKIICNVHHISYILKDVVNLYNKNI